MKTLACVFLVSIFGVAHAQGASTPVPLQIPAVSTYNGATYRCGYNICHVTWSNRNDLIVTGFTPDGNYLNVNVRGWVAIGIGRGYVYHYWCGTMQFDLSGALTHIAVVDTAAAYASCAQPDASAVFTSSGGYQGYSTPDYSSGGNFLGYSPNLDSP
ncbi:MAG TPA: hypothetical protein VGH61_10140 [Steroidobacteraceae bacterium]|jgi:hypothetical protein